MLTAEILGRAVGASPERAALFAAPVAAAMRRFGINTARRQAAFLAQIGHESGSLARVEENLNYTAKRLLEIFPRHFTAETAKAFERKPERIANLVYANRIGNGPEESGDGWRFRGRGLIQVTGRANYAEMQVQLGVPLLAQPELLAQPAAAALSAAAFWHTRGLNALADAGQFEAITRRVNGGLHGHPDRLARYQRALQVLT